MPGIDDIGNKAYNLQELEYFLKEQSKVANIEIPKFLPISQTSVIRFLKTFGYFDKINELWDNGNYQEIADLIQEAFEKNNFFEFTDYSQKVTYGDKVREGLYNPQDFVILRSSSNEDSDELSNAGGNESVLALASDSKKMSIAAGKVIASYFSEKSMEQTAYLTQKDEDDIEVCEDEDQNEKKIPFPKLSFFVQNVIFKGDKVTSGVVYSSGDGGFATINSSLGICAVVDGAESAFDSYMVDDEGLVIELRREKKYKKTLALEDESAELKVVKNNFSDATSSSLTKEQARKLSYLAQELQKNFLDGKQADMEFVICDDKIYIVQVRPVVRNKECELASSLDSDFLSNVNYEKFPISVVNPYIKRSEVILVEEDFDFKTGYSNNMLFAKNISEALQNYLRPMESYFKKEVSCVFVKQNASATSHEAAFFSSLGIPVIFFDYDKLCSVVNKNDNIVIDPQRRGLFIFARQEEIVIKDGLYSSAIENGVTEVYDKEQDKDVKKDDKKRKEQEQDEILVTKHKKDESGKVIGVFLPKRNEYGNLKQALEDISKKFPAKKKEVVNIIEIARYLMSKGIISQSLYQRIEIICDKIINLLSDKDLKSDSKKKSQYYDFLNKLEGLFNAQNKSQELLNSMVTELKEMSEIKNSFIIFRDLELDEQKIKEKERFLQAIRISNYIFCEEYKKKWIRLCYDIFTKDQKSVEGFLIFISKINEGKILDRYVNFLFTPGGKVSDRIKECSEILNDEEFKKVRQKIDFLEERIPHFSDPNKIDELLLKIQEYEDTIKSLKKYQESDSEIVKIFAISQLERFIDIYDLCIKEMSFSRLYEQEKRFNSFGILLKNFIYFSSLIFADEKIEKIFKNETGISDCLKRNDVESLKLILNSLGDELKDVSMESSSRKKERYTKVMFFRFFIEISINLINYTQGKIKEFEQDQKNDDEKEEDSEEFKAKKIVAILSPDYGSVDIKEFYPYFCDIFTRKSGYLLSKAINHTQEKESYFFIHTFIHQYFVAQIAKRSRDLIERECEEIIKEFPLMERFIFTKDSKQARAKIRSDIASAEYKSGKCIISKISLLNMHNLTTKVTLSGDQKRNFVEFALYSNPLEDEEYRAKSSEMLVNVMVKIYNSRNPENKIKIVELNSNIKYFNVKLEFSCKDNDQEVAKFILKDINNAVVKILGSEKKEYISQILSFNSKYNDFSLMSNEEIVDFFEDFKQSDPGFYLFFRLNLCVIKNQEEQDEESDLEDEEEVQKKINYGRLEYLSFDIKELIEEHFGVEIDQNLLQEIIKTFLENKMEYIAETLIEIRSFKTQFLTIISESINFIDSVDVLVKVKSFCEKIGHLQKNEQLSARFLARCLEIDALPDCKKENKDLLIKHINNLLDGGTSCNKSFSRSQRLRLFSLVVENDKISFERKEKFVNAMVFNNQVLDKNYYIIICLKNDFVSENIKKAMSAIKDDKGSIYSIKGRGTFFSTFLNAAIISGVKADYIINYIMPNALKEDICFSNNDSCPLNALLNNKGNYEKDPRYQELVDLLSNLKEKQVDCKEKQKEKKKLTLDELAISLGFRTEEFRSPSKRESQQERSSKKMRDDDGNEAVTQCHEQSLQQPSLRPQTPSGCYPERTTDSQPQHSQHP